MAARTKTVKITQPMPETFSVTSGRLEVVVKWIDGEWAAYVYDRGEIIEKTNVGKNKAAPYWRQILAYFEI